MLSIRRSWIWLGGIWGIGVALGNFHWQGLPLLIVAWLIYASVLTTVGLWFSLTCPSTLRAITYTLAVAAAAGLGFLVLPFDYFLTPVSGMHDNPFWEWTNRLQMGLSPPVVLGSLLP